MSSAHDLLDALPAAKRATGRSLPRRSSDWIGLKCAQGQELVGGGFTEPAGSRTGFGALLLGYPADADLLRPARFLGLRDDKRPEDVARERPARG
ncbi:hypothetical protein [Streptomyces sp. 2321.6]|uniref:hypothetical protein n=1 Tax=Streptomyces sp. 2321.6 TaxID=1938840 RepID=UPI0026891814